MTDQEWLGLMMHWAVGVLRHETSPSDLARLETALDDASASGAPLAWDLLRRRLHLSRTEQTTLSLLIAVELSLEISAMVAGLNKDPTRSAVDIGLLQRTVYDRPDVARRFMHELSSDGALHRYQLVEFADSRRFDDTPFLLRQLRPSRRVIELVHGTRGIDGDLRHVARLIPSPRRFDYLRLPDELKVRAGELARTLDRQHQLEPSPVLVVAGREGSGRRSLLEGVAAELGRACLMIDCPRLPKDGAALARIAKTILREATIAEALPVLCAVDALSPDAVRIVEDDFVSLVHGLVAATGPHGNTRPAELTRGIAIVELPIPSESERALLWREQLGDAATEDDSVWAAARYTVTGGIIGRAARTALAEANARRAPLARADVHSGVRSALDTKISAVGKRIVPSQGWTDLVLPDDVLDEVREIVARVKHRSLVYDQWGLGKKIGKGFGISALFAGPPGTGKTMIAGIIAAELGLDLYQVDLSQVVSKYIGETEKNLAELFDAAEAGHAVLLFDEADSMFAKRTEVKSSNDRYANLEVNFLLQRMETFTGISILTTNLESSIDEAFKRRLSFRITIPLPDQPERERLWRTMLPPNARIKRDVDFASLADRFEMSGGYIKNAIVRAAFFAADSGEVLSDAHLRKAAALEYAGMGKVIHNTR